MRTARFAWARVQMNLVITRAHAVTYEVRGRASQNAFVVDQLEVFLFFCLIDVKIKKIFQIKIKPSTFLARQKVIIRFWIAALKVLAKRRWAVGTINWASILTRAIGVF